MSAVVVMMPGQEVLARRLGEALGAACLSVAHRRFPDGESHVRLHGSARGRDAVVACTLDRPDDKLVPLALAARAARDAGAGRVVLAAPYLPYMRQDAVFEAGEPVSSLAFGALLSATFDGVATVDPHLHRHASLGEVLAVPAQAVAAAPAIAAWVRREVARPVIVGPDEESDAWAAHVGSLLGAPHAVLAKVRRGDRHVELGLASPLPEGTPVIVDDILSTGTTLLRVVEVLASAGRARALAVVVHAVFADSVAERLREAGLARLVSCNTIPHATNAVDVMPALAEGVRDLLA